MAELKFKKIKTLAYKKPAIEKGYTNQSLYVNLSRPEISVKPVTEKMKEVFIGGKGFDLWLMWNAVKGTTKWNDPENEVCISCGPLAGTPIYPGAGKSIVTAISPTTGSVMDSNVGGYFGPYLKFSGFDAVEIQGKALNETVLLVDGVEEKIEILEVSGLPDSSYDLSIALTDYFGRGKPQNISIVSTGPGAKHTLIGCLNFTWYDLKRGRARYKQAGRGGIGTVFADKGIKALVARYNTVGVASNHPADEAGLKEVGKLHTHEILELDPKQNEMARIGTTHLVTIMNDYDLLPTKNFKYGQHPQAPNLGAEVYRRLFDKGFDGCWIGCTVACSHGIKDFVPMTGPYKGMKVFVDGPEYETIAGCGSNLGIFDPYTVTEINFYCDTYGIDTISFGTGLAFAMECFELGLINKTHTGGLDLSFG
ncbi:MAG: aor2, partial [Deltaproteobacteria bacterium]|nr:aor2 [Deltaproteobacteria bacterium]